MEACAKSRFSGLLNRIFGHAPIVEGLHVPAVHTVLSTSPDHIVRYHAKCPTCEFNISMSSDLEFVEQLAEEHIKQADGHEVRVSMDLMDVELRVVRDARRDLGETG